MKPKSKLAFYCRVSTSEQKTDSQRKTLKDWARLHRISADRIVWYQDSASGSVIARKGLNRLVRDIDRQRIDTVVLVRLDRLARSCRKGLTLLADWADKGIRVVSVTQGIDFSGPTGRMMSAIFLSVAEFEREIISERIREGLSAARDDGTTLGRKPNHKKLDRIRRMKDQGVAVIDIAKKLRCSRQNVYLALKKTA